MSLAEQLARLRELAASGIRDRPLNTPSEHRYGYLAIATVSAVDAVNAYAIFDEVLEGSRGMSPSEARANAERAAAKLRAVLDEVEGYVRELEKKRPVEELIEEAEALAAGATPPDEHPPWDHDHNHPARAEDRLFIRRARTLVPELTKALRAMLERR
jgi:hypothetical protein